MPYTTKTIKKYRCALFSSGDNLAKVSLYDSQNKNFATVYFKADSKVLPKASQDASGKYRLYFKQSRLAALIDLLRNEKPIYLHFWQSSQNNTHIATGREPIGEEEA